MKPEEKFEKYYSENDGTCADQNYSIDYYQSGVKEAFLAALAIGSKQGIEEAAEVLNEVWRLCSKIVNSSPDTPIKGEIESMAYMLAHHPLVINKDSILKLKEKV